MLLAHPQLPTCAECKQWLIDLQTGRRFERGGKPQRRPPAAPTPCIGCPKESPDQAHETELSGRNWQTVRLYLRNRAMWGQLLTIEERSDPLLVQNFEAIDLIFRQYDKAAVGDALERALNNLRRK